MQHHHMADRAVGADGQRHADIGVKHRTILDVGVLADGDRIIVATQRRVEPDAGVLLQDHTPHHAGAFGDPVIALCLGSHAIKIVDRHPIVPFRSRSRTK